MAAEDSKKVNDAGGEENGSDKDEDKVATTEWKDCVSGEVGGGDGDCGGDEANGRQQNNGNRLMRKPSQPSKHQYRMQVWNKMERMGLALFPLPCRFRIPHFKGSSEAVERLSTMDVFTEATVIKIGLDKAMESIRLHIIESRKELLVGCPGLREASFLHVKPPVSPTKSSNRLASTRLGICHVGATPDFPDVSADLVIVGSVAVDKTGRRIGKGEGFSDLEYALLRKLGGIVPGAPIVTVVHDEQVFDKLPEELFVMHDVPADWIVTPTQIIEVEPKREHPKFDWSLLTMRRVNEIPLIKDLYDKEVVDGSNDIVLKEENADEMQPRRLPRNPRKFTLRRNNNSSGRFGRRMVRGGGGVGGGVGGGGGGGGMMMNRGGSGPSGGGRYFTNNGGGGRGGSGGGGGGRRRRRMSAPPPERMRAPRSSGSNGGGSLPMQLREGSAPPPQRNSLGGGYGGGGNRMRGRGGRFRQGGRGGGNGGPQMRGSEGAVSTESSGNGYSNEGNAIKDQSRRGGGRMPRLPRGPASTYMRPRFKVDFSLKVNGLKSGIRVRDLKAALMERGVRPRDISWMSNKGVAFLHFAKTRSLSRDLSTSGDGGGSEGSAGNMQETNIGVNGSSGNGNNGGSGGGTTMQRILDSLQNLTIRTIYNNSEAALKVEQAKPVRRSQVSQGQSTMASTNLTIVSSAPPITAAS